MEKIRTLIEKLQQQHQQDLGAEELILTVNMLQAELESLISQDNSAEQGKVYVMMPKKAFVVGKAEQEEQEVKTETVPEVDPIEIEEKVIEVLQVNEKEIEEELNEIKKNAESINKLSSMAHPVLQFEPEEDIPTLRQQAIPFDQPTTPSLNEKLKETKKEVSDALTDAPIKDLKKAIGINDRYLYVNELFRGDEAMYERSIKTINNFSIFAEAEFWIRRELKVKLGWNDQDAAVKQFDQLVRRRFS
jgi:hypothetical protein